MFTGLVEEVGTINEFKIQPPGAKITVKCTFAPQVEMGASISINGCCLTVVEISDESLSFEAVEETLQCTNLSEKKVGDTINLERSLAVGDRMGGHFVTGHIDGLAKLSKIEPGEKWSRYFFELDSKLTLQMASKGSVTVDGVSLTLVDVEQKMFSVALIPHTLEVTTLGCLKIGESVNVETDVLAKYVQQQLEFLGNQS